MDKTEHGIGSPVIWRGSFGLEAPAVAHIKDNTGIHKGRRVYDLDNGHWAYGHQLSPLTPILGDL